ncbi:MAG: family 16 glycoside hydrolase, partial [Aureibaculum sp.]
NEGSVTLNGTVIVEFPVHGEAWDALVANSKFKDWEGFGKYQTGHIGLQDHSDKVWFRNIKIKKL